MDKNGLLVNFLLGLFNWFLAGIHAQNADSIIPEGCDAPSSWTAAGDNAAKDWYCGSTATAYTFTLTNVAIETGEIGWDSSDKKFLMTFTSVGKPTFTATNSCPVKEDGGTCESISLYLSSTVDAEDGSRLKVAGERTFGWLEWKCTITASSRIITYAFPIEKVEDAETSFIDAEAAAVLNAAYAKDTSGEVGWFVTPITDLQDDVKDNWDFFDEVNEYAGAYFMMQDDGEIYKVFSNVTLKLSAARYGDILYNAQDQAQNDGSGVAMAGPPAASDCDKVFKLNLGFVNQTCTECADKCGAMQIAPKMILSILTIVLLQCFKY